MPYTSFSRVHFSSFQTKWTTQHAAVRMFLRELLGAFALERHVWGRCLSNEDKYHESSEDVKRQPRWVTSWLVESSFFYFCQRISYFYAGFAYGCRPRWLAQVTTVGDTSIPLLSLTSSSAIGRWDPSTPRFVQRPLISKKFAFFIPWLRADHSKNGTELEVAACFFFFIKKNPFILRVDVEKWVTIHVTWASYCSNGFCASHLWMP